MVARKEKRRTPKKSAVIPSPPQCSGADHPCWYMNRLQGALGFIMQAKIDEPGFRPVYRVRQRKTSTVLEIRIAKKKRLHIETEKYRPEKKSTFSHYDAELGIYTLQVRWKPETAEPEEKGEE